MSKTKKHCSRWTDNDYQFIVDNYKKMSNEQMAKKLKRTPAAIANQRAKLGLNNWNYGERRLGRNEDGRVSSFILNMLKK